MGTLWKHTAINMPTFGGYSAGHDCASQLCRDNGVDSGCNQRRASSSPNEDAGKVGSGSEQAGSPTGGRTFALEELRQDSSEGENDCVWIVLFSHGRLFLFLLEEWLSEDCLWGFWRLNFPCLPFLQLAGLICFEGESPKEEEKQTHWLKWQTWGKKTEKTTSR